VAGRGSLVLSSLYSPFVKKIISRTEPSKIACKMAIFGVFVALVEENKSYITQPKFDAGDASLLIGSMRHNEQARVASLDFMNGDLFREKCLEKKRRNTRLGSLGMLSSFGLASCLLAPLGLDHGP
jgi:hypothetical protein